MGSATSRNVSQLEPFEPLPSDEELGGIGGRWFRRPSDGRRLEYFLSTGGGPGSTGQQCPTVLNVVCTTATGLLYHRWRPDAVADILRAHGAQMINVSTAGVGASEPYGDTLHDETTTTTKYLEQTSRDLMALLDEVGAVGVYVMGVSGGWEPAAHLACCLRTRNPERLLGLASVSGIPWMGRDRPVEFWESGLGKKGWVMDLALWFNRSWMAAYLVGAMFPMDPKKTIASFPADQKEQLQASGHFSMMEDIVAGMNRSTQYCAFVCGFLGRLTCDPTADSLAHLATLQDVTVHLHYSSKDSMLPGEAVAAWLQEEGCLPNAKLFMTELHHMAVPMEKVLTLLLDSSSQGAHPPRQA